MDYSKVGSNLYYTVIANANDRGIKLKDATVPVTLSSKTLSQCDTILIKNEDSFRKSFDAKPLNVVVNNLNGFGELAHKFQIIQAFVSHTQSKESAEKLFADLKIGALMRAYQSAGIEGVYTLLLNKAAAGTPAEAFNRLNKILVAESKKLGVDIGASEIWTKGIVKKQDFDFLRWKKSGFISPSKADMTTFSRDSYAATNKYFKTGRLDEKIPDGFRDGGRYVEFQTNGKIAPVSYPNREIIYVDRRNDKVLNDSINHLKTIFARNPRMSEFEKIQTLYCYVCEIFSEPNGVQHAADFASVPMKLGDIMSSGAGVCRHMSIAAKVLADELGIKMSLVRGRHKGSNGYLGAHIWNEVELSNGKCYLFDAAQCKLVNLSSNDDVLNKYYTDSKVKMYK